jgi:hypothetical protein
MFTICWRLYDVKNPFIMDEFTRLWDGLLAQWKHGHGLDSKPYDKGMKRLALFSTLVHLLIDLNDRPARCIEKGLAGGHHCRTSNIRQSYCEIAVKSDTKCTVRNRRLG